MQRRLHKACTALCTREEKGGDNEIQREHRLGRMTNSSHGKGPPPATSSAHLGTKVASPALQSGASPKPCSCSTPSRAPPGNVGGKGGSPALLPSFWTD